MGLTIEMSAKVAEILMDSPLYRSLFSVTQIQKHERKKRRQSLRNENVSLAVSRYKRRNIRSAFVRNKGEPIVKSSKYG